MISFINYTKETGNKLIEKLLSRSKSEYAEAQKIVDGIVTDVCEKGDKALFEYIEKFDGKGITPENIKLTKEEIADAYKLVSPEYINIIRKAKSRIFDFHAKQKQNSWFEPNETGEILGQLIRPIERVGVYVPGGTAAYPSSVLMNIIPAKVAGVKEIIMVTPAKEGKVSPTTIVAAAEAGADKIFKVGGAQAIAALAYGTKTIPKVDKICGPGNVFVALAKKRVYGAVNIDSIAGPSEILIIADEAANPVYVAADMLSQAEHDDLASAILITPDIKLAKAVELELMRQTEELSRKEIIKKSLENFGAIITTDDIDEACEISNFIAPEHLEICVKSPFELLPQIKNAGAIFLGSYSPEPLGDYMAGPNHVLPTGGTARFFSPLSIDDFIKKSSLIYFNKAALSALSDDIITFAEAEGLTAHANAIRVRKDKI